MLPARTQKPHPTLEEVRQLFEQWRREKRGRDSIPPALWKAAVALATKHSINEISRHLRLSYTELKARVNNPSLVPSPKHPDFIELAAVPCRECTVELEKLTGERMRIRGNFNVMELAHNFWKA
jgi:hypothetical protein